MGKSSKSSERTDPTVRASGVVPFRWDGRGGIEVLVIHRPRYDDWSFPKGKRDPGETDEACALRELREETGLVGVLGEELPTALYVDNKGRPKEVRYWLMELTDDDVVELAPNEEVDHAEWTPVDVARARLTYDLDMGLLDEALLVINHGLSEPHRNPA